MNKGPHFNKTESEIFVKFIKKKERKRYIFLKLLKKSKNNTNKPKRREY